MYPLINSLNLICLQCNCLNFYIFLQNLVTIFLYGSDYCCYKFSEINKGMDDMLKTFVSKWWVINKITMAYCPKGHLECEFIHRCSKKTSPWGKKKVWKCIIWVIYFFLKRRVHVFPMYLDRRLFGIIFWKNNCSIFFFWCDVYEIIR